MTAKTIIKCSIKKYKGIRSFAKYVGNDVSLRYFRQHHCVDAR